MKKFSKPIAWQKDFPPIFYHTSISFVKHCNGYAAAKSGDNTAARCVVDACVKQQCIDALKANYPSAVLLPVISQKNRLPQALAEAIGLRIHTGVKMTQPLNRKQMTGAERLLFKPEFTGEVVKGESYILVDDIVCCGGTVSALRKYILKCGGIVLAVAALAHSKGSASLNPNPDSIRMLREKFECKKITALLKYYRITSSLHELTYPEVKYLLRFKETVKIQAALDKYVQAKSLMRKVS